MITIANPERITHIVPKKLSRSETTLIKRRVIKRQMQQHQMLLRGESRIYRSRDTNRSAAAGTTCEPLIIADDPNSTSTLDYPDFIRFGDDLRELQFKKSACRLPKTVDCYFVILQTLQKEQT